MRLTRSSWHYQVASFGASNAWRYSTHHTICTYMQAMFRGALLITLLIIAASVLASITIVAPLVALSVSIVNDSYMWVFGGNGSWWMTLLWFSAIWILALMVMVAIHYGTKYASNLYYRRMRRKENNTRQSNQPFSLWLKAIKEKTCFIVEVVDDNDQTSE